MSRLIDQNGHPVLRSDRMTPAAHRMAEAIVPIAGEYDLGPIEVLVAVVWALHLLVEASQSTLETRGVRINWLKTRKVIIAALSELLLKNSKINDLLKE